MKMLYLWIVPSFLVSIVILIILANPVITGDYEITYEKENKVINRMTVGSTDTNCYFEYDRETSKITTEDGSYIWTILSRDHILITENSFVNETYCILPIGGVPEMYGLTGNWAVWVDGNTITIKDSINNEYSWTYSEYVVYPSIDGDYTQYTINESSIKYTISNIDQIYSTYLFEDTLVSINGEEIFIDGVLTPGEVTYSTIPFREANGMYMWSSQSAVIISTTEMDENPAVNLFIPIKPTVTRYIYDNGLLDVAILIGVAFLLIISNYVLLRKTLER